MTDEVLPYRVDPTSEPQAGAEIRALLAACDLSYEATVEVFVALRRGRRIVACAGLDKNIVKCAAISPELQGESLSLPLMTEIAHLAHERGHSHLFLYTKPDNVDRFRACGFYKVVEVPGVVAFMENTPIGVRGYCASLKTLRQPGETIGAIVMNANPFTYGHRHLVEYAVANCDHLHLFVVAEDTSFFSYRDRYAMVKAGISDLPRLTLHPGSEYMVSRATFSSYFFKEKNAAADSFTAIDLLVFRNFIAPALGITRRFVGTEPFCKTTAKYNTDMMLWLRRPDSPHPPIEVVEIPRVAHGEVPISASEVRSLLAAERFSEIGRLVPPFTLALLRDKHRPGRTASQIPDPPTWVENALSKKGQDSYEDS